MGLRLKKCRTSSEQQYKYKKKKWHVRVVCTDTVVVHMFTHGLLFYIRSVASAEGHAAR